jgi:hypothetical protein
MNDAQTLSQYFENGCEIFSRMPTNLVPWNNFFPLSDMDFNFIRQYGERYASSYLKKIDYNVDTNKNKLSSDIARFHYHKWKHLWLAYTSEYNPTENTTLRETVTREAETGGSGTVTNNLNKAETGTVRSDLNTSDTVTNNLTKGETGTVKNDISKTDTVTREVETGDSGTVTNNLTKGETGTVKHDINTSDVSTQTGKKTTTTDNDVYGFNGGAVNDTAGTTNETIDSKDPLKTSETHSGNTNDTFNKSYTDTGTVTNSNTGTESESVTTENTGYTEDTFNKSYTDTGTVTNDKNGYTQDTFNKSYTDTGTVTNSNTGTESETVTTERSGSIGVMTPATMLKIERETWQWNYFRDVMNDVADFISLQIFD